MLPQFCDRIFDSSPPQRCWKSRMKAAVPSPNIMIAILITTLITIDSSHAQSWSNRIVPNNSAITDCEGLGYPNATKNACGFCTEGGTGLFSNYSMDCSSSCTNGATVDCNGVCGGKAYIDECSGRCIGGTTGIFESHVISYRDCRGYCTGSSGGQFYVDECGVCHTGTSPFQDCTNKCYKPGSEYKMAKLLCGRCVGTNTEVSISEVLDACGNCKSDTVVCPCNGTGKPDVCGVCNGGGRSCMKVVSASPRAIPAYSNSIIAIQGAFKGRNSKLKCLFVSVTNGTEYAYNAAGNSTRVSCSSVKLPPDSYRVGVRLDIGDPLETGFIEDFELLVYKDVEYTIMDPDRVVFDRDGAKELVVTFSGNQVPKLPLICIITGEDKKGDKKLSVSGIKTFDSCVITYPKSSMKLTVAPSFNGINPFKKSFNLKFYASPPEMRENYIAEDGHAAMIIFDRPVNLCGLKTCSDILSNETMDSVGSGASCKWATKQQLIITVQNPITTNPLRVTFKKNVLKQDGQVYAMFKNEGRTVDVYYPRPISNAQLAISGPSTVPHCGVFTLVGHFSSPKGDASYYWTVYRGGKKPKEEVANALSEIRTTSLTLNASLLELDTNYTFVLTAEHPLNEKYEARHDVCRKSYIGPLVTAYSNVMSEPSVTVDQKVILTAELTLPECARETETMHLMWSVNNPKVKFDFGSRHNFVYEIKPFSLPENSEIIFTAFAYFSNMLNVTTSRVVLRVEQFKLKATIKGTPKRVVGNKEGNLVLESEVHTLGFRVVYQWKCHDESGAICYNYRRDSDEPLLVPRSMQTNPNLVIPCNSLKAGKVLIFELQVFNANNRYQYSQVESTSVYVVDKNIPQVAIDSVIADNTHTIQRHPNTGAYSIPAGLPVTVYATVKHAKGSPVKWDVKGYSSSFTYTAYKERTMLSLDEGFLVGHGIYLIGLSACDSGACGSANLTIHAVPGIALCKLEVSEFVEYEMISPVVKGCSIPLGRQPVTYQIFLHTHNSIFPLTAPQSSTVFKIVGPPFLSNNGTETSVEVCDKYSLCTKFPGPLVKVTRSQNVEEDRKMIFNKAKKATKIHDPIHALSLYLTLASSPDAKLSTADMNSMLDAGGMATSTSQNTSNRYLNAGQLSLIYSSMLPLIRQENVKVKLKALEAIKRATRIVYSHGVKVPTSILTQGHSNAAEALVGTNTDTSVTNKVRDVLNYFVQMISKTAPLGSRIQLSSSTPGYPSNLVFHQYIDNMNPIYIKTMSKNGIVEGSVKFENAVRDKVRNRPCNTNKYSRCEGIVVALTLYPDTDPFPNTVKKISPVLDITLRKPEDGSVFQVSDVPNAIQLGVTYRPNATDGESKGSSHRCAYWDKDMREWSQEGVVTYGIERQVMKCWSSHLTSFAIIEASDGLSAGSIVGIVVTVLMGVFIIMMLVFFFYKKKKEARGTARVSTEALQPRPTKLERHSDKLQGMNGSVVRVKTVTP